MRSLYGFQVIVRSIMLRRPALLLSLLAVVPVAALGADFTAKDVAHSLFQAKSGKPIDFSGKVLAGLDLAGLDFKGARLTNVDLLGADLSNVIFKGSGLQRRDAGKRHDPEAEHLLHLHGGGHELDRGAEVHGRENGRRQTVRQVRFRRFQGC
ncbi:MAG: pentapeptide repeat-containing protein [Hyphomicrobium sp.]|nr:pentapeptide repeat-containing protein [Hyphomicrobium sp.]